MATSGLADAGSRVMARFGQGIGAQFAVGAVLGAVWSPCVGPTLGAASALAAQGRDIGAVAAVMLAFGLGGATLTISALILTGFDHRIEAALVAVSPDWLTDLTTRF